MTDDKINANRVIIDVMIERGDVNAACSAAIRHIQLVKDAATRRMQELAAMQAAIEAERRAAAVQNSAVTSASICVGMNMDANGQSTIVTDNSTTG